MRSAFACLCLLGALPVALPAQESLYSSSGVGAGLQYRRYSFESGSPNRSVSQFAIPVVWLFNIGERLSIDVGGHYATTKVTKANGNHATLNGFTDTQVRASYVLGNDLVVGTLMLNLPTGDETLRVGEALAASAVSSNFLLFPMNAYGTGFSGTGGVAVAFPIGSGWNLGAAGSLRLNTEYHPFANGPQQSLQYKPGLEGRVRVGADGLIGSTRLAAGFTFSTFSNDQFTGGLGAYSPGNRYIGELSWTVPMQPGSVTAYVWNYYRANQGGGAPGTPSNRENVFTGGVSGSFRLGDRIGLEPLLESRFWSAAGRQSGQLFGAGAALRVELGEHWAIWPGGRVDLGSIKTPAVGSKSVTGWELDGLIRFTY